MAQKLDAYKKFNFKLKNTIKTYKKKEHLGT